MKATLLLLVPFLAACGSAIGPESCPDMGACGDSASESSPDAGCGTDRCPDCQSHAQCAAQDPATPVCSSKGVCVGCASADDCPADYPVCDLSGQCRACQEGAECSSGACDVDGTCVPDAEVVHVDAANGQDTAVCGHADEPCASVGHALTRPGAQPSWVRLWPGTYSEPALVIRNTLSLVFDGGAFLRGQAGYALQIDEGGDLTVLGGTISSDTGDAVTCSHGRVRLRNAQVRGYEHALYAWTCALSIEQSDLVDSDFGVEAHHSIVSIERSRVAHNRRGTMLIYDSILAAENNFFVDNVRTDDGYSVVLSSLLPGSWFRFNTVAGNVVDSPTYFGVKCSSSSPTDARGNIVWNDDGRSTTGVGCVWDGSNLRLGGLSGQPDGVDPLFAAPGAGDYRLAPSSPLIDAAQDAPTSVDFFGSERPVGGGFDLGAHEHAPSSEL